MTTPASYLLVAGAPTPNGRLHLGHLGAQFLKLDLLKRHYLRRGDRAALCFSVDTFDLLIHIMSRDQGRTEEEVCRPGVDGIAQDLATAAIDHDVFLDTSTPAGRQVIADAATELDGLVAGHKVPVGERAPFSRRDGQPLVGRLLTGECPRCGRSMKGNACDPCGLFLSTDQILDVRPADPADRLEWREVTNHFLRVETARIRGYVDALRLPAVTRRRADEVTGTLLDGDHFLTRWTASAPYGVGTGVAGQVYFNHVLVTLAEQVAFGELTRSRLGLERNPFDVDSDAVTVGAYGADNLSVFLVNNVALALATGRYRPFDHQLVSEFFTNGGQKISTSRPDALWVAGITGLPEFSRDGLRGYLLSASAPDVPVDVSMAALTRFMGSLNGRLDRLTALASGGPPPQVDPGLVTRAEQSLDGQDAALALPSPDQPAVWRDVDDWIDRALAAGRDAQHATLAAFAVVAAPALPDAAGTVWRLLGRTGQPDRRGLRELIAHDR